MLQASKNEVRLAVDLYNRSGQERQLEAFIVHMSMGWLKLLQAHGEKTGTDIYERDRAGRRKRHPDGGWSYKSLHALASAQLSQNDPRKVNLEFFTGLRNRIEHRHENNIAAIVSGRTQAHVLNYESTLVEWFGSGESLADELRFPLFMSSLTQDGVAALKRVRAVVPKGVLEWIQDFDTSLEPAMTDDQRFDFRVFLIPHTGPKTEADAAMTFVREEELDDAQRDVLDQVRTIIREKEVPVESLGTMLPQQVVDEVRKVLPDFNLHQHTCAWKYFAVRPDANAANRTATRPQFCRYNAAFDQYVYTPAWVEFLVRKFSEPDTRASVLRGPADSANG